jgi:hypothetical protein
MESRKKGWVEILRKIRKTRDSIIRRSLSFVAMKKIPLRKYLIILAVLFLTLGAIGKARADCDPQDPGNPPGQFE